MSLPLIPAARAGGSHPSSSSPLLVDESLLFSFEPTTSTASIQPYIEFNRRHAASARKVEETRMAQYASKFSPYQPSTVVGPHSTHPHPDPATPPKSHPTMQPSTSRRTLHAYPSVASLMSHSPLTLDFKQAAKRIESSYRDRRHEKYSSISVSNLRKTYLALPTPTEHNMHSPHTPHSARSGKKAHAHATHQYIGSGSTMSKPISYEPDAKQHWSDPHSPPQYQQPHHHYTSHQHPSPPPPPYRQSAWQDQQAAVDHAAQLQRLQALQQQTNMQWALQLKSPPNQPSDPAYAFDSHVLTTPPPAHQRAATAHQRGWHSERAPRRSGPTNGQLQPIPTLPPPTMPVHTQPTSLVPHTDTLAPAAAPSSVHPSPPPVAPRGFYTSVSSAGLDTTFILMSGGVRGSTDSTTVMHQGSPRRELVIKHAAIPPPPPTPSIPPTPTKTIITNTPTNTTTKTQPPIKPTPPNDANTTITIKKRNRTNRTSNNPQKETPKPPTKESPSTPASLPVASSPSPASNPPPAPLYSSIRVDSAPSSVLPVSFPLPAHAASTHPEFEKWIRFLFDSPKRAADETNTTYTKHSETKAPFLFTEDDARMEFDDTIAIVDKINQAALDGAAASGDAAGSIDPWSTLRSYASRLLAAPTGADLTHYDDFLSELLRVHNSVVAGEESLKRSNAGDDQRTDEIREEAQAKKRIEFNEETKGMETTPTQDDPNEQQAHEAIPSAQSEVPAEHDPQAASAAPVSSSSSALPLESTPPDPAVSQSGDSSDSAERVAAEEDASALAAPAAAAEQQEADAAAKAALDAHRLRLEEAAAAQAELDRHNAALTAASEAVALAEQQRAVELAAEEQHRVEEELAARAAAEQRQQAELAAAAERRHAELEAARRAAAAIVESAVAAAAAAAVAHMIDQQRVAEEEVKVAEEARRQQEERQREEQARAAEAAAIEAAERERAAADEADRTRRAQFELDTGAAASAVVAAAISAAAAAAAALIAESHRAKEAAAAAAAANSALAATRIQSLARGRAVRQSAHINELKAQHAQLKQQYQQVRDAMRYHPICAGYVSTPSSSHPLTDVECARLSIACGGDMGFLAGWLSETIDANRAMTVSELIPAIEAAYSLYHRVRVDVLSHVNMSGLLSGIISNPSADSGPITPETLDLFLQGCVGHTAHQVLSFSQPEDGAERLKELCARLSERDLIYETHHELSSAIYLESISLRVTLADVDSVLSVLGDASCTLFPSDAELEVRVEEVVDMIRLTGSVNRTIDILDRMARDGQFQLQQFGELRPAVERYVQQLARDVQELGDWFDTHPAEAVTLLAPSYSSATGVVVLSPSELETLLQPGMPMAELTGLLSQFSAARQNFETVDDLARGLAMTRQSIIDYTTASPPTQSQRREHDDTQQHDDGDDGPFVDARENAFLDLLRSFLPSLTPADCLDSMLSELSSLRHAASGRSISTVLSRIGLTLDDLDEIHRLIEQLIAHKECFTTLDQFIAGIATERTSIFVSDEDISSIIACVSSDESQLFAQAQKDWSDAHAHLGDAAPPFELLIEPAHVVRMIRSCPDGLPAAIAALETLNARYRHFSRFEELLPAVQEVDEEDREHLDVVYSLLSQPEVQTVLLPHQSLPTTLAQALQLLRESHTGSATGGHINHLHSKGRGFENISVLARTIYTLHITTTTRRVVRRRVPTDEPEEEEEEEQEENEATDGDAADNGEEADDNDEQVGDDKEAEADADAESDPAAVPENVAADPVAPLVDPSSSPPPSSMPTSAPAPIEDVESGSEPPPPSDDTDDPLASALRAFLNAPESNIFAMKSSRSSASSDSTHPLVLISHAEVSDLLSAGVSAGFTPDEVCQLVRHAPDSGIKYDNIKQLQAAVATTAKEVYTDLADPNKAALVFTNSTPIELAEVRHWMIAQPTVTLSSGDGDAAPAAAASASMIGLNLPLHLAALQAQNDLFTTSINDATDSLPRSEQQFPNLIESGREDILLDVLKSGRQERQELNAWIHSSDSGWIGSLIKQTERELRKSSKSNPVDPARAVLDALYTAGCFTESLEMLTSILDDPDTGGQSRPTHINQLIAAMRHAWVKKHLRRTQSATTSVYLMPPASTASGKAATLEAQLELNVQPEMNDEEIAEARSQYISLELAADKLDRGALPTAAWSHPFIRILRSRSTIWEKVCDTNVVRNTSSPQFNAIILNLYRLNHNDVEKDIKIQAYSFDPDGGSPILFGEVTTNLKQILASAQIADTIGTSSLRTMTTSATRRDDVNQEKRLVLKRKVGSKEKEAGFLIIRKSNIWLNTTPAVLSNSNPHSRLFPYPTECLVQLIFAGRKLEKQRLIGSGKADPFIQIFGVNKELFTGIGSTSNAISNHTASEFSKRWSLVFTSEVVPHTLNPVFLPVLLKVDDLCGGEYDRDILVRMMTNKSVKTIDGNEVVDGDLIGEFETSLRSLLKSCNSASSSSSSSSDKKKVGKRIHLINPRKKVSDKSYKHSGDLIFLEAKSFTLSARSSELQASVFNKIEKSGPNSRRQSLGLASLSRSKSKQGLLGTFGVGDATADLQKSSLLQKAAAIARLTGADVDQPTQSEMVESFVRQRTGFGHSRHSSGGPGPVSAVGRVGSTERVSATDKMIATLMQATGGQRESSTRSTSPTQSMRNSRNEPIDGNTGLNSLKLDSQGAPSEPGSKRSTLKNLSALRHAVLPDGGVDPQPAMAQLASSIMSTRRQAKAAADRRAALSINLSFRATDMRKMDLIFGWCDAYLQISRKKDDVWSELASTTVVSGSKNPVFDPVSIRLSKLRSEPPVTIAVEGDGETPSMHAAGGTAIDEFSIAGGTDYPLMIKAFHWKKRGEPEFMGAFETTLTHLQQRSQTLVSSGVDPSGLSSLTAPSVAALTALAYPLIDPTLAAEPKKGKEYKHSGLVFITNIDVVVRDKATRQSRRRTLNFDAAAAATAANAAVATSPKNDTNKEKNSL